LEKEGKIDEDAQINFIPQTFYLPSEYYLFVEEFKRLASSDNKILWIMKPISKCQGKGIFIISKLNQIALWKSKTSASANKDIKEKPLDKDKEKDKEKETI
jgi:hypothetical protein